jgi:hypothetical protein
MTVLSIRCIVLLGLYFTFCCFHDSQNGNRGQNSIVLFAPALATVETVRTVGKHDAVNCY